jgi:hypothetical protein
LFLLCPLSFHLWFKTYVRFVKILLVILMRVSFNVQTLLATWRIYNMESLCPRKWYISPFFYSHVHTMFGSFLPPSPTPSLTSPPPPSAPTPSIPGGNYFALISNFVEDRV